MKVFLNWKQRLLIGLLVIVVMIPIIHFSTHVHTAVYDIANLNHKYTQLPSRSGSGGSVTGLGYMIETKQGTVFRLDFSSRDTEVNSFKKAVDTNSQLLNDVMITYKSYLFGFMTDIQNITLKDGESFTFNN
jgi:hypothetical protein